MHITLPPLLRRYVSNKQGRVVLWQSPNAPLLAWLIFTLIGMVLHDGSLRSIVQIAAHIAIIIWALLEVFWGASPFRRTLGVIVLMLTVISILR
jgi:hypothetical protein